MSVCNILLLLFLAAAVGMDLYKAKIPNLYLMLMGAGALLWQIIRIGPGGILFGLSGAVIPVIILFPLFRCRMLGAGDIKLFSAVGCYVGAWPVLQCMCWSFLLGAVISLFLMLKRGILPQRLNYFKSYIQALSFTDLLQRKTDIPPYRVGEFGPECIHFSVPVFLAVLLKIGGAY